MVNEDFLYKSGLVTYDSLNCLRGDYFHNKCSICIDICPVDALGMVGEKLRFVKECTSCSACIGSCPTEAISIDTFDPNEFAIEFSTKEGNLISCKSNVPCLSVFDSHHLISMALRESSSSIVCDTSHCDGCEINIEGNIKANIQNKIDSSNGLLQELGLDEEYSVVEQSEQVEVVNDRRGVIKNVLQTANKLKSEGNTSHILQHKGDTRVPAKLTILKNSLKPIVAKIKNTHFNSEVGVFANRTIDFQKCTNCKDCAQFCPTNAIEAMPTSDGYIMNAGVCIDCDICNDICKTGAVESSNEIDIINILYDRAVELVKYDMVVCKECKTAYPYKGGDPICDRCIDFTTNFSDMFTLAKDI